MKLGNKMESASWINARSGFTLIELVIAMAVTAVIGIAMIANYVSQQRAATVTRQVAQMQQQLRGAMYIMEQDIRIAGWTPNGASGFGVTNVQRWSITDEKTEPAVSAAGSPSLTVAYDWNPANPVNDDDGVANEPQPAYRLFDDNGDGIFDLVRDDDFAVGAKRTAVGSNIQLVAEGIDAIGFAYAYDSDGDGNLERNAAGNVIWAVDSDNDNFLDTDLDANADGVIDLNDDTDGDRFITPGDGAGLAAPIPVANIRMVRVWLLARARNASRNFSNTGLFIQVGDQIVPNLAGGFNDNIRRRLLIRTVECRNTGI